MNWLSNFVRPRIRAIVGKREIPDNMWVRCPSCSQMIFHRELQRHLHVCPHCGHHMRLGTGPRFQSLFDHEKYTLLDTPKVVADPLSFRDKKKYTDRLRDVQQSTGIHDTVRCATGKIGGCRAVVAAFDFRFLGGSMGIAAGEAIVQGARRAVKDKAAFITVTSSGGARMQEAILSLMQMTRTILAISRVKKANLPYISILADPTTGGVSASFAMLGDIVIAESGATIGFAGARVIQDTIRQELPKDFQKSNYLFDHGMVDMVVSRKKMRSTLGRILDFINSPEKVPKGLPKNQGEGAHHDII